MHQVDAAACAQPHFLSQMPLGISGGRPSADDNAIRKHDNSVLGVLDTPRLDELSSSSSSEAGSPLRTAPQPPAEGSPVLGDGAPSCSSSDTGVAAPGCDDAKSPPVVPGSRTPTGSESTCRAEPLASERFGDNGALVSPAEGSSATTADKWACGSAGPSTSVAHVGPSADPHTPQQEEQPARTQQQASKPASNAATQDWAALRAAAAACPVAQLVELLCGVRLHAHLYLAMEWFDAQGLDSVSELRKVAMQAEFVDALALLPGKRKSLLMDIDEFY